jgi:hypothetical protein
MAVATRAVELVAMNAGAHYYAHASHPSICSPRSPGSGPVRKKERTMQRMRVLLFAATAITFATVALIAGASPAPDSPAANAQAAA